MGQAADDIVDGFVCSWCGQYFDDAHGHPFIGEGPNTGAAAQSEGASS